MGYCKYCGTLIDGDVNLCSNCSRISQHENIDNNNSLRSNRFDDLFKRIKAHIARFVSSIYNKTKQTTTIDTTVKDDIIVRFRQNKKGLCLVLFVCVLLSLIAVMFSTCIFFHHYSKGDCETPQTCRICNKVKAPAPGHDWVLYNVIDSTCSVAGTEEYRCSRCGAEGAAKLDLLDHVPAVLEYKCTEDMVCANCGVVLEEAPGHQLPDITDCAADRTCTICGEVVKGGDHTWVDADCDTPKTCSVCGKTDGKPLGHTTDNGICERCGNETYKEVHGSGDDVREIKLGDGIYRLHFINKGKHNIVVRSYNSDNDRDLLINEIGNYDGYVLLLGSSPLKLEIQSSGDWSYRVERLGLDFDNLFEMKFSGKGDYVTNLRGDITTTWRFTHDGSSNFVVRVYSSDGASLVVNEIGKYDGKKIVKTADSGYCFFEIKADGNWTAEKILD